MKREHIDEVKKSYDIAFSTGFNWYINHLINAVNSIEIGYEELGVIEDNINRLKEIKNNLMEKYK